MMSAVGVSRCCVMSTSSVTGHGSRLLWCVTRRCVTRHGDSPLLRTVRLETFRSIMTTPDQQSTV